MTIHLRSRGLGKPETFNFSCVHPHQRARPAREVPLNGVSQRPGAHGLQVIRSFASTNAMNNRGAGSGSATVVIRRLNAFHLSRPCGSTFGPSSSPDLGGGHYFGVAKGDQNVWSECTVLAIDGFPHRVSLSRPRQTLRRQTPLGGPGAGIPPAGICAGGYAVMRVLYRDSQEILHRG